MCVIGAAVSLHRTVFRIWVIRGASLFVVLMRKICCPNFQLAHDVKMISKMWDFVILFWNHNFY